MLYRLFFFVNDPAPTEIYTLSLHDALPIGAGRRAAHHPELPAHRVRRLRRAARRPGLRRRPRRGRRDRLDRRPHGRRHRPGEGPHGPRADRPQLRDRSEEHTSELQSRQYLVCRLLLEKNKNNHILSSITHKYCHTLPSHLYLSLIHTYSPNLLYPHFSYLYLISHLYSSSFFHTRPVDS